MDYESRASRFTSKSCWSFLGNLAASTLPIGLISGTFGAAAVVSGALTLKSLAVVAVVMSVALTIYWTFIRPSDTDHADVEDDDLTDEDRDEQDYFIATGKVGYLGIKGMGWAGDSLTRLDKD